MQKNIFILTVRKMILFQLFFGISCLNAQNGLENILVEKYYISNANDTAGRLISGFLPPGSVTYRIYLDMLPEYRFHAAYGSSTHELRIETSTKFFNNEDIGATMPNVIPRRTLKRNTVMLDSWLSVGAAGEQLYGVLKEEDDSLETIVHEKSFLQATNKLAGIPIKERDGLIESFNVPFPTFFGIDSAVAVFFNSTSGSVFDVKNGAWGCLGGAIGSDSLVNNRLLIAQITTDGDLSFELNIQIGKRGAPAENYVAKNPTGKEISLPFLTYNSKSKKLSASKNKKIANTK
jgi:hypothetical protein